VDVPTILWQGAAPNIVDWFMSSTQKNYNEWYT